MTGNATDSDRDESSAGVDRCPLCREFPTPELRPHAIEGRETIPLMCGDCFNALLDADRLDQARDRKVFGYGQ